MGQVYYIQALVVVEEEEVEVEEAEVHFQRDHQIQNLLAEAEVEVEAVEEEPLLVLMKLMNEVTKQMIHGLTVNVASYYLMNFVHRLNDLLVAVSTVSVSHLIV